MRAEHKVISCVLWTALTDSVEVAAGELEAESHAASVQSLQQTRLPEITTSFICFTCIKCTGPSTRKFNKSNLVPIKKILKSTLLS